MKTKEQKGNWREQQGLYQRRFFPLSRCFAGGGFLGWIKHFIDCVEAPWQGCFWTNTEKEWLSNAFGMSCPWTFCGPSLMCLQMADQLSVLVKLLLFLSSSSLFFISSIIFICLCFYCYIFWHVAVLWRIFKFLCFRYFRIFLEHYQFVSSQPRVLEKWETCKLLPNYCGNNRLNNVSFCY